MSSHAVAKTVSPNTIRVAVKNRSEPGSLHVGAASLCAAAMGVRLDGIIQRFAAPNKLGIDLRQFLDLVLQFSVGADSGLRLSPLLGCFEQEFLYVTGRKTLHQVMEWAVLLAAATAAVWFAAGEGLFDIGAAQKRRGNRNFEEENTLAIPQISDGYSFESEYLSHISGYEGWAKRSYILSPQWHRRVPGA